MSGLAFDLPRGRIFAIEDVDVRLEKGPSPFETANREAIERNWEREKKNNPALFNGTVVLLSSLRFAQGRLTGTCHAVSFAAFLYWRGSRGHVSAEHCFAHAMLVSSDNALIAARMGPHTLNAGRVYFAAGSFEPGDFRNGRVDIHHNMVREVAEETGLDISNAPQAAGYLGYSSDAGTAIFRRYDLSETAERIAERVRRFVASEADPEISEPVIIRGGAEPPEGLLAHMRAIVDWHFGTSRS
ncbi:MAG: hypothetical protein JJ864_14315 [Rhizobiaceae bacterium]|nr:hypothetical protein [Rhizobiaceae bacterium]